MKHLKILVVLLMILPFSAVAEEPPVIGMETDSLAIKLSKDGTGIIKNIGCYKKCEDFKIVRITKKTKAFAKGVRVDILQARSRAGKPAYIEFTTKKREVVRINW